MPRKTADKFKAPAPSGPGKTRPGAADAALARELEEVRAQLAEAQEALRAIREGEVDAIVVSGSAGEQVFSLTGAEQVYRLIVETMREAAITVTFEGTILYANEQFSRLVGQRLERIIGNPLREFVGPRSLAAVEALLRAGRTKSVRQRLEFLGADGAVVPAHVAANLLSQPGGASICLVATDLTELESSTEILQSLTRQKEALRSLVEQLALSNQELEQFAYVASHDLQEPLRMVGAYTELLRERYQGKLDEKADQYITFAVEGANRMRQLINDLLAYSRISGGAPELRPCSARQALETALADLHLAIRESGAAISQDPLPVVRGDVLQMAQVFQNLIANAIKFRQPTGAPAIHVGARRLECASSPGEAGAAGSGADGQAGWLFFVRDNGIGIDPRYFDKIFEIFQRLHSRSRYGGTGIGLAICRKIVGRHGGRIWVESEPGRGATFFFSIPDAPPGPDKPASPEQVRRAGDSGSDR